MKKEDLTFLSLGLNAGFVGETERGKSDREGFIFETSHFEDGKGKYHDEWVAGRVGGGQEVIQINGKSFTRLYAGGTIDLDELTKIGLTKKDVILYLKEKIRELGDRTRLLEHCTIEDGDWNYEYCLLDEEPDIPLVTAKEIIRYRGKCVFVHNFLLCPVG
jgi:hypothetical protein